MNNSLIDDKEQQYFLRLLLQLADKINLSEDGRLTPELLKSFCFKIFEICPDYKAHDWKFLFFSISKNLEYHYNSQVSVLSWGIDRIFTSQWACDEILLFFEEITPHL